MSRRAAPGIDVQRFPRLEFFEKALAKNVVGILLLGLVTNTLFALLGKPLRRGQKITVYLGLLVVALVWERLKNCETDDAQDRRVDIGVDRLIQAIAKVQEEDLESGTPIDNGDNYGTITVDVLVIISITSSGNDPDVTAVKESFGDHWIELKTSKSKVLQERFQWCNLRDSGVDEIARQLLQCMAKAYLIDKECTLQLGSSAIMKFRDQGGKLHGWMLPEDHTPYILGLNCTRTLVDFFTDFGGVWTVTGMNLDDNLTLMTATLDSWEPFTIVEARKVVSGIDVVTCKGSSLVETKARNCKGVYTFALKVVDVEGVTFDIQSEVKDITKAYWMSVLGGLMPSLQTLLIIMGMILVKLVQFTKSVVFDFVPTMAREFQGFFVAGILVLFTALLRLIEPSVNSPPSASFLSAPLQVNATSVCGPNEARMDNNCTPGLMDDTSSPVEVLMESTRTQVEVLVENTCTHVEGLFRRTSSFVPHKSDFDKRAFLGPNELATRVQEDTNHDGQLTEEEFDENFQILQETLANVRQLVDSGKYGSTLNAMVC